MRLNTLTIYFVVRSSFVTSDPSFGLKLLSGRRVPEWHAGVEPISDARSPAALRRFVAGFVVSGSLPRFVAAEVRRRNSGLIGLIYGRGNGLIHGGYESGPCPIPPPHVGGYDPAV